MNLKAIVPHGVAVDLITEEQTITLALYDEPSIIMPLINFLSYDTSISYQSADNDHTQQIVLQKENNHILAVINDENKIDLGTIAEFIHILTQSFNNDPNAWIVRNYRTYKRHGEKGTAKIAEILALPGTQKALKQAADHINTLEQTVRFS